MKITTNMDVNKQTGANYTLDNKLVNKNEKADVAEKAAEVSLSTERRCNTLSDEELQCALENLLVSQSSVYDVQTRQYWHRQIRHQQWLQSLHSRNELRIS